MTRDEIRKIRAEEPRRFDALVAEEVMGWKFAGESRNRAIMWWEDGEGDKHWTGESNHVFYPFRPTEDPAADYSVLKLVRETWSKAMQEHFCRRLPSLAEYEVGDISEVALEVACMRDEGVIPNQEVE